MCRQSHQHTGAGARWDERCRADAGRYRGNIDIWTYRVGGLVAGESVVVIGPGPIGLLAVAVAKALDANPVILTGTRNKRLAIGREFGADRIVNQRRGSGCCRQTAYRWHRLDCAGNEATINQAIHMTNRGGKSASPRFRTIQSCWISRIS